MFEPLVVRARSGARPAGRHLLEMRIVMASLRARKNHEGGGRNESL